MKKLIILASLFVVQTVMAEPIVWDGKFYSSKQQAQKTGLIPDSKPAPALAIEISKAQRYFIGSDALIWQKRNILKQYHRVQDRILMARHLNNTDAILQYRSVKAGLHLQLGWINEQLSKG